MTEEEHAHGRDPDRSKAWLLRLVAATVDPGIDSGARGAEVLAEVGDCVPCLHEIIVTAVNEIGLLYSQLAPDALARVDESIAAILDRRAKD